MRDGLLARNPAVAVKRPGIQRTEARTLAAVDVAALLAAAQSSPHHAALVLIAATGLRRGEDLALRWEHIDLDDRSIKVRGTLNRVAGQLKVTEPKTQRSRRTVPISPALVTALVAHREQQHRDRLHAGALWTETGHVFTTATGQPVDPRELLNVIYEAAEQVGAGRVGIHTLRHAAASTMLEAGVNIKAVSDLLGHSSIAITGDIYGHTSDQTARAAADLLSGAIGLRPQFQMGSELGSTGPHGAAEAASDSSETAPDLR